MFRVLRRLGDAKLVKETGDEWAAFVPACDPDRIMVEELLEVIEVHRAMPELVGEGDAERAAIAAVFKRLSDSTHSALDRLSIGQLVRELYTPRAPSRFEDRRTLP